MTTKAAITTPHEGGERVRKGATILKLLTGKDKPLLVRRDALLVLDLGFHVIDGVRALNLQGNGLPSKSLHEDLHPTPQAEDKVESGLLLYVVISKGATILQLLASKDQSLLIWRNAFLILDLCFHVVDGVRAFHLEGDSLAGKSLNKDLHPSPQTENKMQG
ncbi:hypothetical protein T12_10164 [Trichinella patagoniensis]|uniref:Uncharacterized protein n=1 Tax=Trichinella patagoniensis TaxID=990121 RepID=A0A0V0YXQ6_9BILA|nr:hypothetical protein T12_10164 [Trichinella patagoniensis]